jgi:hypothetical protein
MGKAEDELRRRLRAHADDRKHEEEQAQASADLALERLISEVQQLVPDALAGLHRTNWRNGELLEIRALLRSKEIAACPIGGYRFRAKGDGDADRFNYLYLLRMPGGSTTQGTSLRRSPPSRVGWPMVGTYPAP